jgi:hypothetical protein
MSQPRVEFHATQRLGTTSYGRARATPVSAERASQTTFARHLPRDDIRASRRSHAGCSFVRRKRARRRARSSSDAGAWCRPAESPAMAWIAVVRADVVPRGSRAPAEALASKAHVAQQWASAAQVSEQADTGRVCNRGCAGREPQLGPDVGDMPMHGMPAEYQPLGDLGVAEARCDQVEDLEFARG